MILQQEFLYGAVVSIQVSLRSTLLDHRDNLKQ